MSEYGPSGHRAPRERAAAARRRGRRRTRARRRLAPLALALVVVAAAVALASSVGSHAHSRSLAGPAAIPTTPKHPRATGRTTKTATATALAASGESSEIRKLIELGRPIYCAGRRGNEVALTFDDGPGPYTQLVLAKLRKHRVRATFFVVGRNIGLVRAKDGSSIVRQERGAGMVGDHTFTHPLLPALSPMQAEQEMVGTQVALARASGGPVFLFRPPYGAHNATVDGIARRHGLLEILWTVDSADSLGASYSQIEHNVISGLRPGAIILMHENHGQTVRALINIFGALKRRHLRAVSVAQLLTNDPPSAAQLRTAGGGCGVGPHASLSGG